MQTQTLLEKLESLDCRKDEKARRVLNVAPDTIADISADELEKGVSLERLESLNVPVLRYTGQVTIHGKLPSFNPGARPGGYKAIFQNGNGSIGVRYAAIDAGKKEILARCARVVEKSENGQWFTSRNSSGFEVIRYWIVKDETQREDQKLATIAALKSFPVSRFFGSIGAFSLAYGVGYGVVASIGAIPESEVWPFCAEIFGIENLATLEAREREKQMIEDEKQAEWRAEYDRKNAEDRAKREALIATLKSISSPPENGIIFVHTNFAFLKVELTKEKGRDFYQVLERDGMTSYDGRKLCKAGFPYPKALAANRIFVTAETFAEMEKKQAEKLATATTPESAESVSKYTSGKDENGAPSPRQTFALFCATGKDWRNVPGLTYGKVSQALGAVSHLRGKKSEAKAIAEKILIG